MKTRIIISVVLGLITLVGLSLAYAGVALYCTQSFSGQNVPLLCTDTQPDTTTFIKVLSTVFAWMLLFGLPFAVTMLYKRFGWPRQSK